MPVHFVVIFAAKVIFKRSTLPEWKVSNKKIQPKGGSLFQGSSTRKMTDKGFYWKLENLAKDFTVTIAQWRKQANEIQVLLSDSKDTQEIRNGRNMLMDIMSRFEATYSTIDAHFTDSNGKAAEGTRTQEEFQGKYDGIANDHHTVLRNITSCLQDLEFDSASRNSNRTSRSRSSRTSKPFPVQNGSSSFQNGNSSFQNGNSSVQNGNSSVQKKFKIKKLNL